MKQDINWLREGLACHLAPEQLTALQNTRVGIAGAGGLGSNVAHMLARCGIHQFVLADFDRVDASNLNRQFYFPDQVGLFKVEALAEHLLRLNPDITLTLTTGKLTWENMLPCFAACPVIVEALDNAASKAMYYQAFRNSGRFYAGASGLAGWETKPLSYRYLDAKTVIVGDFSSEAGQRLPPMAPRVIEAASMQANAVLAYLLGTISSKTVMESP